MTLCPKCGTVLVRGFYTTPFDCPQEYEYCPTCEDEQL